MWAVSLCRSTKTSPASQTPVLKPKLTGLAQPQLPWKQSSYCLAPDSSTILLYCTTPTDRQEATVLTTTHLSDGRSQQTAHHTPTLSSHVAGRPVHQRALHVL
eukprot:GHRQ01027398.1.p1 GENE.GHRQ01027398.1~~GHRQ01027398.1.p1  ORF type:complete len:103 (+),score=2.60 GHRQ01027398.1:453-761(+)